MTYKAGDRVYILHDHSGHFHLGIVTGITPTGRINVYSVCFSGYHGQFNQDGTLRGEDWQGGTHLVPVPEGTSTEWLEKEKGAFSHWLFGSYLTRMENVQRKGQVTTGDDKASI